MYMISNLVLGIIPVHVYNVSFNP